MQLKKSSTYLTEISNKKGVNSNYAFRVNVTTPAYSHATEVVIFSIFCSFKSHLD